MTEKSWVKEFYRVPAENITGASAEKCVLHSLRKWEGARKKNLKKHGLTRAPIRFGAKTCSLCVWFREPYDLDHGCAECPLYQSRGGVS